MKTLNESRARRYIRGIKDEDRRAYAQAYADWLLSGRKGREPSHVHLRTADWQGVASTVRAHLYS